MLRLVGQDGKSQARMEFGSGFGESSASAPHQQLEERLDHLQLAACSYGGRRTIESYFLRSCSF